MLPEPVNECRGLFIIVKKVHSRIVGLFYIFVAPFAEYTAGSQMFCYSAGKQNYNQLFNLGAQPACEGRIGFEGCQISILAVAQGMVDRIRNDRNASQSSVDQVRSHGMACLVVRGSLYFSERVFAYHGPSPGSILAGIANS